MTEIEIFMSGGGFALLAWAVGLILNMGKGAASESQDF